METTEALKRQLEVAEGLHGVVKTMKVLAAASIRQYEEAVRSLGAYDRTVEQGLQVVLRAPAAQGLAAEAVEAAERTGVVVFGSGQGLCGRFNEQIVAFAAETLRGHSGAVEAVLVVGERAVGPLEAVGVAPAEPRAMPSSIAGITPAVQSLVLELEAWRSERDVRRILLFHNRPASGSASEPHVQQLFPLDDAWLRRLGQTPWPTRQLPTFSMARERLLAALVRQYIFVSLYRALAESLTGEHASRLASMQTAEKNIADRLDQLQARYRRQRQHLITEEVLDIMSGFEALTTGQPPTS